MADAESNATSIYHITTPEQWSASAGSAEHRADSLQSEGFIHCSTRQQLERSLNRFFQGVERVTVLTIDPDRLENELKYEPADGDSFPHIYGPINTGAVVQVEELSPNDDGRWSLEPKR